MSDHTDIGNRVMALRRDMLERRKALNDEHYYPRLAVIQADCAKIGHERGIITMGVAAEYYTCAHCGAVMEETRHAYDDEGDGLQKAGEQR